MKLFKKIGILFLAVYTSSCESFLEVEEVGRTSIPVFFQDMDGMRAALPGAYSKVYDYYDGHFMLYPDAAGDLFNMVPSGEDTKMYSQFNYLSTPQEEVGAVGYIWRDALEALANVNNILEYHPDLLAKFPMDKRELALIKGEALFLRAMIHFDLVRVYAQPYNYTEGATHPGIPILLRTPGADDNIGRSSVGDVYEQILADLDNAGDLLQDFPKENSYFASHQAVQALKARVYLYKEDWTLAKQAADEVLSTISLTEGEDYEEMYTTLSEGSEAIFRLNGNRKASSISEFYTPVGPTAYASEKLVELLSDTTDIRSDLLENVSSNTYATKKFHLLGLSEEEFQVDLFVLRASELYLIRAEANVQLNNLEAAIADIKTIQARAYQLPESEITIEASTPEELLDLILDERAKELSFEGHRLFDLTRMGRDLERPESVNSSLKSLEYPSPYFILPFPESEVNTNTNIIQNPEY